MTLRREVPVRRELLRARHVLLAILGCAAVLLGSQQCAERPTRLDAVIERDPLPGRHR